MDEKEFKKQQNEANEEAGNADDGQIEILKNLKGEFNRKLGNTEEQIKNIANSQQQLVEAIIALKGPQQKQQVEQDDSDLADLMYSDPAKYAQIIEDKITEKVMGQVNRTSDAKQQQSEQIIKLTQDYPELRDQNSDLTKEALKIYGSMSSQEQNNPMAYKAAIREAAANQGILPVNKRRDDSDIDNDSFSFSGSYNNSNNSKRQSRRDRKMPKEMISIAERFGIIKNDGSDGDKKVMEALKRNTSKKLGEWS